MIPTGRLQIVAVATGILLAVGAAVAVWGCEATECRRPMLWGPGETLLWAGAGLAYIVVGVYTWQRYPQNQLGRWMAAVGFAWFLLPDDEFLRTSLARTWDVSVTYFFSVRDLYIPVLVGLALVFPLGRLRRRDRFIVAGLSGFYLLRNLSIMAIWVPALGGWGDVENLLLINPDPALLSRLESFVYELDDPILLVLVGVIIWHWWTASKPGRRHQFPLLLAAIPWTVAFIIGIIDLWIVETSPLVDSTQQVLGRVGLLVLPFGFLASIMQTQAAHARLGPLLDDLAQPRPPGELRGRLAEALGDPSLQLAYNRPGTGGYVDHDGRHLPLPSPNDQGRSVTVIGDDEQALVALIHDPALDEKLVKAAGAAVRLALENERLHATVRAQLEEVRASRARIVEAADTARREVERDLHDGAQQRLVTLSLALQMARDRLERQPDHALADLIEEASKELNDAIDELRELARGIYPTALTEGGLSPALETLVERFPVPVRFQVDDQRYPSPVEHTAYFVVAEALTNVAKHAQADTVTITINTTSSHLVLVVADDGVGGADPGGAGLQGIADRVAAHDGELRIESKPGLGTTIECRLPLNMYNNPLP